MRTAEVANLEQDERAGEMIALLNMMIYAQAIADELQLANTTFYLTNAVQELSAEVQRGLRSSLPGVLVASLAAGKVGNC